MKFKAVDYLINDWRLGYKAVSGFAVDGLQIRMAVHKEPYGWVADDWDTGARISTSWYRNRPEAVKAALDRIEAAGGMKAHKKAQRKFFKHGVFTPGVVSSC